MRTLGAVGLAAILMATTAGAGVAAVGSDQAREANAQNAAPSTTQAAPTAKQPGQTGQADTGSGKSVGPGAGGNAANTPLGYAKGPGENSSVGKQH
jgi:threonine dehydrogenase-like Zn-dependent dehydrogenase